MSTKKESLDVRVENHGSVIGLRPLTDEGKAWIRDNTDAEGWQFMGETLCVDARLAGSVIEGMQADGLLVAGG